MPIGLGAEMRLRARRAVASRPGRDDARSAPLGPGRPTSARASTTKTTSCCGPSSGFFSWSRTGRAVTTPATSRARSRRRRSRTSSRRPPRRSPSVPRSTTSASGPWRAASPRPFNAPTPRSSTSPRRPRSTRAWARPSSLSPSRRTATSRTWRTWATAAATACAVESSRPLTVDHSLDRRRPRDASRRRRQLLARMPRHVVTRALGMEESVRVSVRTLRVFPGRSLPAVLRRPERRPRRAAARGDPRRDAVARRARPGAHRRRRSRRARRTTSRRVVVECARDGGRAAAAPVGSPSGTARASATADADGSAPEIIIVGVETHVVPANSANASLLDALGPLRAAAPAERARAVPSPSRAGARIAGSRSRRARPCARRAARGWPSR